MLAKVAGGRSHLRKSDCLLAGRAGLPCVGDRWRLRGLVDMDDCSADVGIAATCGASSAVLWRDASTRGLVRRLGPGEAGRARRLGLAGIEEEEEEDDAAVGGFTCGSGGAGASCGIDAGEVPAAGSNVVRYWRQRAVKSSHQP